MKKIIHTESHKIALRLTGWPKLKDRRPGTAALNFPDSGSAVLSALADELNEQMWESDFGSKLLVMDRSDCSSFPILVEEEKYSAGRNFEIMADTEIKPYSYPAPTSFHELNLELDPELARQKISLKNFSVSVQRYWIRLQNSQPEMTVDSFCAELMIQRSYFYKLLRTERQPSRNLAIALCLALKLDIKEAQDLLMNLGEQLNHQVKRDYILIFGFEKSLMIDQVEELLIKFESRTLLGRF